MHMPCICASEAEKKQYRTAVILLDSPRLAVLCFCVGNPALFSGSLFPLSNRMFLSRRANNFLKKAELFLLR